MEKHQYSARKLITVKNWLDENPSGLIPTGRWTNPTLNKSQWHSWFIECLNAKINQHLNMTGRKYTTEYEIGMRMAQSQINHPRLIIDWLPRDLTTRFAYRLRENLDA